MEIQLKKNIQLNMKRLDLYLIRQFLTILGISILGFTCIFLVVDLIENLDRFIDNTVSWKVISKYYVYTVPWFFNIALPMSMLIATVFSVGLLVKRNEWTAMKSSGISLYRIAIPLIIIGIIISYASFEFENRVVSSGNEMRSAIEQKYIKKKSRRKMKHVYNDVFLQKKEKIHIALGKYKVRQKSAEGVTIISMSEGIILKRIDAKTITWIDSLERWAASEFSIRTFDENGYEIDVSIPKSDSLIQIDFTPDDILKQGKLPDELNYNELTERIVQLKENGVKTTRWEVTRYFKISFAFTNLIVVLFGLPLVVIKPRGGLTFGAGMSFLVIFFYYAFIKFGQSLGFKGVLEPMVSAWIGNVVFSIGGLLLLLFARK
jgi:LPS export ABC transporter permease LptG